MNSPCAHVCHIHIRNSRWHSQWTEYCLYQVHCWPSTVLTQCDLYTECYFQVRDVQSDLQVTVEPSDTIQIEPDLVEDGYIHKSLTSLVERVDSAGYLGGMQLLLVGVLDCRIWYGLQCWLIFIPCPSGLITLLKPHHNVEWVSLGSATLSFLWACVCLKRSSRCSGLVQQLLSGITCACFQVYTSVLVLLTQAFHYRQLAEHLRCTVKAML